MDLYEQIIYEMLEIGELETAKIIFKEAIQPSKLYETHMQRCNNIEYICK